MLPKTSHLSKTIIILDCFSLSKSCLA